MPGGIGRRGASEGPAEAAIVPRRPTPSRANAGRPAAAQPARARLRGITGVAISRSRMKAVTSASGIGRAK